ncbi:MAG: hypothetical protein GX946_05900 [Oligosphaeraceae bacterium]|nr:hypothetical protein [Oligosphaeraceae bacterium]
MSEIERQRRRRLFLRFVLPGAIVLLVLLAFILRKPIKYIFSPAVAFQNDFMSAEEGSAEPDVAKPEEFGNAEALLHIKMRFADKMLAPENIIELAHAAVDSKPSEVYFTLEYRLPHDGEQENEIKINDNSLIELEGDNKIDLNDIKKEEDFILALQHSFAQLYPDSKQKLDLQVSEEIMARRQQAEACKPTLVIPETRQSEIKAGDKSIVLPDFKADSSKLPRQ